MAIGLGKQFGAEIIHWDGFGHFKEYIPMFGNAILKNAPVLCGVALLENAYDKTREIVSLTPQEIIDEEPKLLLRAKSYMPRILFDSCDVLIVDQMGKNISGDAWIRIFPDVSRLRMQMAESRHSVWLPWI